MRVYAWGVTGANLVNPSIRAKSLPVPLFLPPVPNSEIVEMTLVENAGIKF